MLTLASDFFNQNTVDIARSLIGTYLIHQLPEETRIGRIVETEAYLANDPANHAYRGMTNRNKVMFGPPGHWYIYFVYGRHYCLNVSTANKGKGEAVLIRALEPIEGIELMQQARQKRDKRELCNGPARLVQAMAISSNVLGKSVLESPLSLSQDDAIEPLPIATSPRIGISQNKSACLRFYRPGSPYLTHT